MEIFLIVIVALFFLFIILRPVSKKELKKFEDKDNWSNMGF